MSNSPRHDAELLRDMYIKKRLDLEEMADEFGVVKSTVMRWLDENGIERRTPGHRAGPINLTMHADGYPRWRHKVDGEDHRVRVHRLLAVSEYGIDTVANSVIHHKNGIPWDNRPDNIEVLSRGEHVNHHRHEWEEKRRKSVSESSRGEANYGAKLCRGDVIEIRERYDSGESATSIAEDFPVSYGQIRRIGKRESWRNIREQD